MRRQFLFVVATVLVLAHHAAAQDYVPDFGSPRYFGGLIIARQGNQTTTSFGGVFLPRKVKTVTQTPEGPVVTKFTLASPFHSPVTPPFSFSAPGRVRVSLPQADAVVYIDGVLLRSSGTVREFESPPLPQGSVTTLRIRAAYLVDETVWIEDRQIDLRPGLESAVTFDGVGARVVRVADYVPVK